MNRSLSESGIKRLRLAVPGTIVMTLTLCKRPEGAPIKSQQEQPAAF